ncbi:MAG: MBL fold metallo-hydrolase [Acidobacteria bacterium]|nr:MBL fold metallo-hydrolase [Acidobacteriota bacterium]
MTRAHVRLSVWLVLTASAAIALACGPAAEPSTAQPAEPSGVATARYLANAAVLVTSGATKAVFDPLYRNDFGRYELVPDEMERALFAGDPPFDGLDAVFISHHHEDHFSAIDVLRLLEARPSLRLYAPAQAVEGIREIAADRLDAVMDRVHAIALEYRDAPVTLEHGTLLVEAVRIPHSGWPERQQQVENIAFRVTLDAETTVVHLGDADASDAHFAPDGAYWSGRRTDLALPPYWFFLSAEGRQVLERRIAPTRSIGVHVPADVPSRPSERAAELRECELLTQPGEVRTIR